MTAPATLTRSVEDYLKAIYRLSLDGQPATTTAIAQALMLAPPSVSGMIRRLSGQGLLEHAPYRGVALTDEGRRVAVRMVRRHRIMEAYLVARLGYSWDTVHDEAERLEHALSEELIERMAEALGNPAFAPRRPDSRRRWPGGRAHLHPTRGDGTRRAGRGRRGIVGSATNEVDGDAVPARHFRLILTMAEWQALAARLGAAGTRFVIEPHTRFAGEVGEQSTMFLSDPSGNALEFKAFADDAMIFAR